MRNPFILLTPGLRLVLVYYLLTPLFWLVDSMLGWHLRLVFLEDPAWKALYYSALLACGVVAYLWPGWLAIMALVESTISIGIHLLSFMSPVFTLPETVLQGKPLPTSLDVEHISSFVLAGLVLSLSFQTAVDRLSRRD